MIGQSKLLQRINSYDINTFPHSVLLTGERGSGKHEVINIVAKNLNLEVVDITDDVCLETIDSMYLKPTPYIYTVNLQNISQKEQNVLLKIVEEPLLNSFIILMCENKSLVLKTIINRCIQLDFDVYTLEELRYFITTLEDEIKVDTDMLLTVARTPGKILEYRYTDIKSIYDFCNKIFDSLPIVSFGNILTITNRIGYKNEQDKINVDIFLDILFYTAYENVRFNKYNCMKVFDLTRDLIKSSRIPHINKQYLVDNYLVCLKSLY